MSETKEEVPKPLTRGMRIELEKERYVKMTKEEHRKLYKCGGDYLELHAIPTWAEYFSDHRETLSLSDRTSGENVSEITGGKTYSCEPELNRKVSLWRGDITRLEVDVIVNAANKSLMGGGGVDGSIHSAAGRSLTVECSVLGGCPTGEAKITSGYKLPAKYVIHTVGPIGEGQKQLQSCYRNSLALALQHNLKSIAFPCISTGVYRYPPTSAAAVALDTVRTVLQEHHHKVDRVIFCVFLAEDLRIYEKLLPVFFPPES